MSNSEKDNIISVLSARAERLMQENYDLSNRLERAELELAYFRPKPTLIKPVVSGFYWLRWRAYQFDELKPDREEVVEIVTYGTPNALAWVVRCSIGMLSYSNVDGLWAGPIHFPNLSL